MHRVIAQCINQFRCVLRATISSSLRLRPLTTGMGEGEALGGDLTVGEQRIFARLQVAFPEATHIQVTDVSDGCGAMYEICIESPSFVGLNTVQQHRLVKEALVNEIKTIVGLELHTKASASSKKK